MKNTKGQLGNLQGVILAVIVIGILLGAAFLILDEFQDETDNVANSIINETDGFINSSGYTVLRSTDTGFNSLSVTEALEINSTDGAVLSVISANNFTVSGALITNSTVDTFVNVTFSYTYLSGGNSFIGVNQTVTALLTVPNLLGLIILIALVGIILQIVFNVIPGARVTA